MRTLAEAGLAQTPVDLVSRFRIRSVALHAAAIMPRDVAPPLDLSLLHLSTYSASRAPSPLASALFP